MTSTLAMGKTEWLMLLILSLLWGGSFFFAKVALVDIPPLTLVFLRVALAAVALGLLLRCSGHTLHASGSLWLTFAAMGLINNLIPFSLLFWGQTEIGAGLASIFNALVPVFTVVVAHILTNDEKLNRFKLIGVGIGVLGVAALIGIDMHQGISPRTLMAMSACFVAAVSYAFASVYGRRFHGLGISPMFVAFGQVTATAVMILPIALVVEKPFSLSAPGTSAVVAVTCLALFSTALAYVLFFRILAVSGATSISLVTFLIPISAISLGAAFLDEAFAWNHVLGTALVFIGLIFVNDALRQQIARLFVRQRKVPACAVDLSVNRKCTQ